MPDFLTQFSESANLEIKTDSFTLDESHLGKTLILNKATKLTVTVPLGRSAGFVCRFIVVGVGVAEFVSATGVTINVIGGTATTIERYCDVVLTQYSPNTYQLSNFGTALGNPIGFTSTATAGGTTTFTSSSTRIQLFTGTQNQMIVLPVTSTMQLGFQFLIINNSTGTLTVQPSSGLGTVVSIESGGAAWVTCISLTGTTPSSWDAIYVAAAVTIPYTPASASGPASLAFAEDTDNGVNTITVKAPAAVTANVDFTLPDAAGTAALISQTITNGVTASAPSEDAVFDALALKASLPLFGFSAGQNIASGSATPITGCSVTAPLGFYEVEIWIAMDAASVSAGDISTTGTAVFTSILLAQQLSVAGAIEVATRPAAFTWVGLAAEQLLHISGTIKVTTAGTIILNGLSTNAPDAFSIDEARMTLTYIGS